LMRLACDHLRQRSVMFPLHHDYRASHHRPRGAGAVADPYRGARDPL